MSFSTLQQSHRDLIAAQKAALHDAQEYGVLTDEQVLVMARFGAEESRLADAHNSLTAGQLARRSAPELGSTGLAQRTGHRTVQELVRVTTGASFREAATAVRVGLLTADAVAAAPTQPWLQAVGLAVAAGTLSTSAADAIRVGLGSPSDSVPAATLATAAEHLCTEATTLDVDRLGILARQLRDEIDEAGIADREHARHDARTLRVVKQADGMTRLVWVMDPETAATVTDLYDRATSPRRGGPRFVTSDSHKRSDDRSSSDSATAERIAGDTRSTEQLASDTFTELLRHGAAVDSSQLLGSGAPVVRILVTADALDTPTGHEPGTGHETPTGHQTPTGQDIPTGHGPRTGHGFLDGQNDPVNITTVERLACAGATQTIRLNGDGSPLDVGREHRLYTKQQRTALAARDGGCMFPNCDRPPSWCECHHIMFWTRDRGRTDLADGILLCRHHHLLLHNNGWEIHRHDTTYWLIPPLDIDHLRTPIRMHTRSRALTELLGKRTG
jgi:hypothetical protein